MATVQSFLNLQQKGCLSMTTPLEISFHGVDKSEAVEARIHEKFARLHGHFDRITHARVVISSPNKAGARAKMFNVTIDIGIPGQQPIVIDNEGSDNADVFIALRDAFAAAQRKLDATAGRLTNPAKRERARRKPAPSGAA
jgi:ribosome-associated translation inhibitor RaiA